MTDILERKRENLRGVGMEQRLPGQSLAVYSCAHGIYIQREGMDQLEYQPMPSLRDVANDGVLCTFSNR
jgi:hypothetical protein